LRAACAAVCSPKVQAVSKTLFSIRGVATDHVCLSNVCRKIQLDFTVQNIAHPSNRLYICTLSAFMQANVLMNWANRISEMDIGFTK
jgi:hypothetical protein